MVFNIDGKIALITGGASGIGLYYAKELLRNGLRGVTIADINNDFGAKALNEIEAEFGKNKAIFIQTDVTDRDEFERAFLKSVEVFNNMDILINNAGVVNDAVWEKEIAVNFNGVVNGVLLGLEKYIPQYKTRSEGVIINVSSTAGIEDFAILPIYTGTKFAVVGMSKAFGDKAHYERTKVRVLVLCPGATITPSIHRSIHTLGPPYQALRATMLSNIITQGPKSVALAMVEIIKNAKTGTVWVAEGGQEPYEHIFPEKKSAAK